MRPPNSPPRVGIIGGGVAGLSCAARLQELGVAATLYDTGKRGPGGRCSSRTWRGVPADHAAQFAEARTATFAAFLESLASEGKVRRLEGGAVATLTAPGVAETEAHDAEKIPRYVGVGGMGALTDALASSVADVRTDVWVSPNGGIRRERDGCWTVREAKGVDARYDAVVIAHNGKCAERLTSRQPSRAVHALLRTRFAPRPPVRASAGGGRMTLNSIYSLLVEVQAGVLPAAELGACNFVACEPSLRMLSNNARKQHGGGGGGGGGRETEVWSVLSSASFGKEHKAAQEFLEGSEKEAEVTGLLLAAVSRACGVDPTRLSQSVVASKLCVTGARSLRPHG
jgi:phytoene dehydrogenase-like protein